MNGVDAMLSICLRAWSSTVTPLIQALIWPPRVPLMNSKFVSVIFHPQCDGLWWRERTNPSERPENKFFVLLETAAHHCVKVYSQPIDLTKACHSKSQFSYH